MWDKFLDQRLSCHAWFGTSSHDPVVQVAVRSRPDSRSAQASNELWHPLFHHLDRHSSNKKKLKPMPYQNETDKIINIYKWRTDTDLLLLIRCIFEISSWIKNCWCDLLNITHISNIPSDYNYWFDMKHLICVFSSISEQLINLIWFPFLTPPGLCSPIGWGDEEGWIAIHIQCSVTFPLRV